MSDISPLASRVGGEGVWGNKIPLSLHYLAQGEGMVGGLRSLLLGLLTEMDLALKVLSSEMDRAEIRLIR
jgi:hypothetical protein